MTVIEDNALIFSILEEAGQLPPAFNFDKVYTFEKEDVFSFVIYTASGNEKGFLLFRISGFSANASQLNELLFWLQERMETNKKKVLEDAVEEVNRLLAEGGNTGRYFDAH